MGRLEENDDDDEYICGANCQGSWEMKALKMLNEMLQIGISGLIDSRNNAYSIVGICLTIFNSITFPTILSPSPLSSLSLPVYDSLLFNICA